MKKMSSEELKFSDKSFLGIKLPEQMAKRLDKTELHEIVFLIELHQSGDESAKEIVENLFFIFENEMKYFFDQILELKSSEESLEKSRFFDDFNEKLERISMKKNSSQTINPQNMMIWGSME